ncbi:MAG: molybdenum cofactor biosynthesis protein MoaE [Actinomycetota bacterium]|nr:molybdenum cofactor biosynthesis protein MoaE [Actinomycetota bacterium]
MTVFGSISSEPLDVGEHEAFVADPAAGATVVFCGVVRDLDHGRKVVELEYRAHPSVEQVLAEVVDEVSSDDEVIRLAVSHRIGVLAVGDVALVAAVSTGHRAEAFAACARVVELVKARLPIWKRQVFEDGTDEWVNCP